MGGKEKRNGGESKEGRKTIRNWKEENNLESGNSDN